MQVTINAEPKELPEGMSVADLVQHLALDPKKVAIERNLTIVPKSRYAQERLCDKDEIEIVGFIGGG